MCEALVLCTIMIIRPEHEILVVITYTQKPPLIYENSDKTYDTLASGARVSKFLSEFSSASILCVCEQQRLWRVCLFAISTKILCAGYTLGTKYIGGI